MQVKGRGRVTGPTGSGQRLPGPSRAARRPLAGRGVAALLASGLVAVGGAACGTSTPKAASPNGAGGADKTAFCNADVTLDQAGNSVTSMDGFLAVLKNHPAELSALKNDGPASIRSQARALVAAEEKAVADNNASELESPAPRDNGAAVDTFCGVDGSGKRLPSYFAAGKGTAFCSVDGQINHAVTTATSPTQVLAFLTAHPDLVNEFAADLSSLPAAQKAEAQQLVTTTRTAMSTNDATPLGSQTTSTDAGDLGVYCGENM